MITLMMNIDMDKAKIIQEYLDKLEYAIGRVDADVLAF